MSKADYKIEGTVPRELLVSEVRKAARQFAMQFFHFSKVLYDQFGLEKTKDIVRQTVFELAVDRSDQLREKALAQGLKADSVEDFMSGYRPSLHRMDPGMGRRSLSLCGSVENLF